MVLATIFEDTSILIIIVGVILLTGFLFSTMQVLTTLFQFVFKDYVNRHFLIMPLNPEFKKILAGQSEFYNRLNSQNKIKFEKRVNKFIAMKKFIPRGGLKDVTAEMKTLIAAAAVQITFGYPNIYFEHFWRILIYPDTYRSTITKKLHHGEINIRGLIVLSWKRFKEGFDDYADGKNLGLHEMAHAFIAENRQKNIEYDFLNNDLLALFDQHYILEKEKILRDDNSFFRNYGAANEEEFFSVVIENYFEKPAELFEYNPKLYALMSKLLKQNVLKPNTSA